MKSGQDKGYEPFPKQWGCSRRIPAILEWLARGELLIMCFTRQEVGIGWSPVRRHLREGALSVSAHPP